MRIRPASIDDAETIAAMLSQLAAETGDAARFATTAQTVRVHGFGPEPHFQILIADGPLPQGMALYFPHYSTTRAVPGVYVQDLWVNPDARGKGLGADLLSEVATRAEAEWGARYLALTAHGHNAAAQAFYERMGLQAQRDDVPMVIDSDAFVALMRYEGGLNEAS